MNQILSLFLLSLFLQSLPAQAIGKRRALDPSQVSRWDDPSIPTISAGFYQVQNDLTPGQKPTLAYLSNDLYWDEGQKMIYRGLRGVFSEGGSVTSKLTPVGRKFFWHDKNWQTLTYWSIGKNQEPFSLRALTAGSLVDLQGRSYQFIGARLPELTTTLLSHRGYAFYGSNPHGIYPQNTLPAFDHALMVGYQGFEVDVHLTLDGKLLVIHDNQLNLTTQCSGEVDRRLMMDLSACVVSSSPILPNMTDTEARVKAPLVGLDDVLTAHLSDPRVEEIVVDIKDYQNTDRMPLLMAFQEIFNRRLTRRSGTVSEEKLLWKKMHLIQRDPKFFELMKNFYPQFTYSLEGSTGIEPITQSSDYIPELRGESHGWHDGISTNLGLTMIFPTCMIQSLIEDAHHYGYQVMGWTVNGRSNLGRIFARYPSLDQLLTDSPYLVSAKLQLDEATSPGYLKWSFPEQK